ncbi:hypothetical protein [Streptomyces phaeochromogenes]
MGATLKNVVPGCLSDEYLEWLHERTKTGEVEPHYLVHTEAGKRIYQLYAELDQPIAPDDQTTLSWLMRSKFENDRFGGRWALGTMGTAGGQTIVGAFSTGTHGGDFDRPPVADYVCAIHLVADGGNHFWIEPTPGGNGPPALTDDEKLISEFNKEEHGDPGRLKIERRDDIFDAVLVSMGRFGVIYSVIIRAVPQHEIREQRRIYHWQDIKTEIKNTDSWIYKGPPPAIPNPTTPKARFLMIPILLTPVGNFEKNLASLTWRWTEPLSENPGGRVERVGKKGLDVDELIQAHRFENAGNSHPYSFSPGVTDIACMNGNFAAGLIGVVIKEFEEFIDSGCVIVGSTLSILLTPGAGGVALLVPSLLLLLVLLKELLELLDPEETAGQVLNTVREKTLGFGVPGSPQAAAGLLFWQALSVAVWEESQGDRDLQGISYAMMDTKDYLQRSCEVNVDSVEVFFDATDDRNRVITFIDALIAFEKNQEFSGKAAVGYASLRFTGPSRALLGEQRWELTCAVEVAALRDVEGSQELINYATTIALHPDIQGLLHWGQRNDYREAHVRFRYFSELDRWRSALSVISDGGRLDGFSSAFTRRVGLEP